MWNPREPALLQGYELSRGSFSFICRQFAEHLLCATLTLGPEHTVGPTTGSPAVRTYRLLGTWTPVGDCRTQWQRR